MDATLSVKNICNLLVKNTRVLGNPSTYNYSSQFGYYLWYAHTCMIYTTVYTWSAIYSSLINSSEYVLSICKFYKYLKYLLACICMYFDNIADVTESAIIAIANHSCKGVCAYERYMLVSIHGHGIFSKFHQNMKWYI